ncbi:nitrite reductase large subunit NirB [Demequina sp. SYSU T00039]|uniref:assimilatory sulfite reductase (ferredoxin) n=2 Tax=Demequina lignilytica TaxID=3051663 RepID=A0AAW7M8J3_9MICO|nr:MULTISPECIES: nitrite reductase large subunit NirB [unclassified Demequina]MDN4478422.1 nitrite reductase large subunit NirB [Demequina sp. SYSU T00039-1]MDN4487071.1 nitrite reductase large subunit NirB [Demequina sp. SYSU T00039]
MMTTERIVVVGGGMVAHRFTEALRARDAEGRFSVEVLAEEPRAPYDRVALTSYFKGASPEDLHLGDPALWHDPLVTLHRDTRATGIDRDRQVVEVEGGREFGYDHLVLATGSYAWTPPTAGSELPGVFVYRTLDDVAALRHYVQERREKLGRTVRGAVIGGGLLGLEAAGALQELGATSTVIQFADRLMNLQVDEGGGEALKRLIENLGVTVRCSTATQEIKAGKDGHVGSLLFADGAEQLCDVVVFATGVRPRDELGKESGLEMGARGGVVVDDTCLTADPAVSAIGEVACIQGACIGLIAPGNTMAEIAVDRLLGGASTFPGADTAAKLKLLGVDVASFGDAFATTPGALEMVYADPVNGVYKKLVLTDDASTLLGGILVGDASAYASLRPMVGAHLPGDPAGWLLPEGAIERPNVDLPDEAGVCSCNNVSAGSIRGAVNDHDCHDLGAVKACTKAGTSCGSCLPLVKKIMATELEKSGIEVSNALCEHFSISRAQLFNAIKVSELTTFTEIIDRFGTGRGCDICKPTVGSILASLYNEHVLAGDRAALQDTNDRMMANMQKDGTYSVVPRIPGGEITPEGLITIGEVARDFGLYTKITGGQRIDMFGARLEELPKIWKRLVDEGFESGHAYGKSLRTVKSCVGSTWCRYGVQDSVGMAIALELRYRGLRSPHKLKLGVSGCARECAEARGKDVGVIATDNGWNVYVGGNGGFTPVHAQLLVEDVSDEEVFRVIDRYLMYYIRTADRLQRTAPWQQDHEGGLDRIREIVVDDSLGLGEELDAHMSRHIDTYEDEWKAVLSDPVRLRQFASFVNAPDQPDPSLAYVEQRGQRRPATPAERENGPVLIAPTTLEVRS